MKPTGDADGGQAGSVPSAKLSRKFSGSARFRVLIDRAQQALEEKNLAYKEARAVREHLLRLLRMLDAATVDDAHITLLHQMSLRTQSVPRPPALSPVEALAPSPSYLPLDSLPTRLVDYDDGLLDRISQLQLGDFIELYRVWSGRVSTMVLHVACHGERSHFARQFEDAVLQFAVFHTVHAWTMPHQQLQAGSINMLTGQMEQPPEGWYERVAQQLPPDKAFGQLVKSGVEFIHAYEDPAAASRSDHAQGISAVLRHAAEDAGHSPVQDTFTLVEMEAAVEKYYRISSHIIRQRLMVTTYLFTNLWNRFGPSSMAQLMCNCWPYAVRGVVVFEAYLCRPEVASLLAEDDGDTSTTTAGAAAAAGLQQGMQFNQTNASGRRTPSAEESLERLEGAPYKGMDTRVGASGAPGAAGTTAAPAAAGSQRPGEPGSASASALFPSFNVNPPSTSGPGSGSTNGIAGLATGAGMRLGSGFGLSWPALRLQGGGGSAPGAANAAATPAPTVASGLGTSSMGMAVAPASGEIATAGLAAAENSGYPGQKGSPAHTGMGRNAGAGSTDRMAGTAADKAARGQGGDRPDRAEKALVGERTAGVDKAQTQAMGRSLSVPETTGAQPALALVRSMGNSAPVGLGASLAASVLRAPSAAGVGSGAGAVAQRAPSGVHQPQAQALMLGDAHQQGSLQLPLLSAGGGAHGLVTPGAMLLQPFTVDLGGKGGEGLLGKRGQDGSSASAVQAGSLGLTQAIEMGAHGGLVQLTLPNLAGPRFDSLYQQQLWAPAGLGNVAAPLMAGGHHARAQPGTSMFTNPSWLQQLSAVGDADALRALQQQQQQQQQLPAALQQQQQQLLSTLQHQEQQRLQQSHQQHQLSALASHPAASAPAFATLARHVEEAPAAAPSNPLPNNDESNAARGSMAAPLAAPADPQKRKAGA